MVAVDILTGYLGAGKTTLLRHALEHGLDRRRVAVVVNELGSVGVDGTVLAGPATIGRMVELTNGCICCSLDEIRFERALQDLVERTEADLVVIETTGVADPAALAARLRRLGYGIDAITTVVDGAAGCTQLAGEPIVARQVAAADFVVVSKADVASAADLARLDAALARRNARATRLHGRRGAVDPALLFATGARRWRRSVGAPSASVGRGPDGVEAFVFRTSSAIDLERFERVLDGLPATVVRAKGVLRVAGADAHCVFNYASGRRELSWTRLPDQTGTQAVFIGRGVRGAEPAVAAALATCVCDAGAAGRASEQMPMNEARRNHA